MLFKDRMVRLLTGMGCVVGMLVAVSGSGLAATGNTGYQTGNLQHTEFRLTIDQGKWRGLPQPNRPLRTKPSEDRVPLVKSRATLQSPPPIGATPSNVRSKLAADAIKTVCGPVDFANLSGWQLIDKIKSSPLSCLNELYSVTGSLAGMIFPEYKMRDVAYAYRDSATYYPGNNSEFILQLITFLRAGYYVQYYNKEDVGEYGPDLKVAIRSALDRFFASSHFLDINDNHGQILSESVILIDSSTENARYLWVVKALLNAYSQNHAQYWHMNSATNSNFTVLFRGHYNEDFVALIKSDPGVIDVLNNFRIAHTWILGTDNEYILTNSVREMGRFLQYVGSVKDRTKTHILDVLADHSPSGSGSGLWLEAGAAVYWYDYENCADYQTCNFKETVAEVALPVTHSCPSQTMVRAQQMTSGQLDETCQILVGQDDYFHDRLQTGRVPVADDYNEHLEVVVFNNWNEYNKYAGILFGISTNNGGMYLEGDPSDPNNQARFIAHEADWMLPEFKIWNLEHEYTHYLDGRYNVYGDFNLAMTIDSVWWLEGLAEYMDKRDDNQAALDLAPTKAFQLSTLIKTKYEPFDQDRIYRWGYLAIRFYFERHWADVQSILDYLRTGQFADYTNFMNAIGTTYDAEFHSWLDCIVDGSTDCSQPGSENFVSALKKTGLTSSGNPVYYSFWVPDPGRDLKITTTGGTGNVDLYVGVGFWPSSANHTYASATPGNEETVSSASLTDWVHYYITLTTDSSFSGVTLKATYFKTE